MCIKFKKFLEFKSDTNYIFSYKGKNVIRTNHKKDRYNKRNTSKSQTIDLFKKAIVWLSQFGVSKKKYAFISKSSKIGMMVDYRPDARTSNSNDQLILITWFGNIEKEFKGKTPENFKMKFSTDIKVLLENIQKNYPNISGIIEL